MSINLANYCVKDDLYTKHEKKVSKIKDIEALINFLDDRRLEQIREDDKNLTPSESIARINILIESREKENAADLSIKWPTQEIFRDCRRILFRA